MKDFKLPLKLAIECCYRENKDMQADEASLKQYNKMTADHKLTTDLRDSRQTNGQKNEWPLFLANGQISRLDF